MSQVKIKMESITKVCRAFIGGYILHKGLITVIRKKGNSLSFSTNLSMMVLLREITKRLALSRPLQGVFAGLPIFLMKDSRQLSVFTFSRAMSELYKNYNSAFVFMLCQIPIMISFICQPQLLDKTYCRWIEIMGDLPRSIINQEFAVNSLHNSCINLHQHCMRNNLSNTLNVALHKIMPMYIKAHILSVIICKAQTFYKSPTKCMKNILLGSIRSTIFLTSYILFVKFGLCTMKNYPTSFTPVSYGVVAGILSGLSIFIEAPRRRTELALYCVPQALTVMLNYWKVNWGYMGPFLFLLSSAIFHSKQDSLSRGHHIIFELIFGSKFLDTTKKFSFPFVTSQHHGLDNALSRD
jgi:hypothetical protein